MKQQPKPRSERCGAVGDSHVETVSNNTDKGFVEQMQTGSYMNH